MAAPSKKIYSVGLNAARIYALTAAGKLAATNLTVYNGVSIGGPMAFEMDFPDPDLVAHPGNNTIQQYDVLPSIGTSGGTLTVSREDADTLALVSGTKVHVHATAINSIGWHTSQQGLEPTVALVTYDQSKDESGNRVWRTHVCARAVLLPKLKGMKRDRGDIVYTVQPSICTAHLIGLAFTANDDGFTTAQVVTYTSNHRLGFSAWVTTATETIYTLDVAHPAAVTGGVGMIVTKNDVLMTYGATADATHYTANTTTITFGAALTNTDRVACMYEMADTAVDIDN